MNHTILNYCIHAIEALNSLSTQNKRDAVLLDDLNKHNHLIMSSFIDYVSRMLHKSIKFTLPDNGHLLDDSLEFSEKKLQLFKLPYPIVSLEFEAPDLDWNLIPGNLPSTKRIALALDFDQISSEDLSITKAIFPTLVKYSTDNKVIVISVYHIKDKGWLASRGACLVSKDPETSKVKHPVTGKPATTIKADILPIQLALEMEEHQQLQKSIELDTNDEMAIVVDFCAVMNCNNVSTAIANPSENQNKKRARNGKLPMYAYHVLMLNPLEEKENKVEHQGGTHASPRLHLRRGHIRRLADNRVTWVNAAMIGNKKNGVVEKSYAINS
jgi:hypothetical protein